MVDLLYPLEYGGAMITTRARAVLAALCALLVVACNSSEPQPVREGAIVLAAASLQESLEEVAEAWKKAGHPQPTLSFAGSSALARQIENGAPADLFVSADEEWMDELERQGLLREGTRQRLLGNTLVLIAPATSTAEISLSDPASLPAALGDGRLAIADPEAVPAGRYGKAALEKFGVWGGVSDRIAPGESVRAALAMVENGQSPLGLVYATDALVSVKVKVVARFPADSHPPIRYPAAVLKESRNADAEPFLMFLSSAEARKIFAKYGFTAPQ